MIKTLSKLEIEMNILNLSYWATFLPVNMMRTCLFSPILFDILLVVLPGI